MEKKKRTISILLSLMMVLSLTGIIVEVPGHGASPCGDLWEGLVKMDCWDQN